MWWTCGRDGVMEQGNGGGFALWLQPNVDRVGREGGQR